MFLRLLFFFLCLLPLLTLKSEESILHWAVYYSDKAPIRSFDSFSLLVLDPDYHPSILALKERKKKLLGYINLGEVEQERFWFNEVKKEGILFSENPNWPGSFYVDFRSPLWTKRVIEKLIPNILHKGFDGLFLDTLDNAAYLENLDPSKYGGMKDAAARLVHAIHYHYPTIPIMQNRGYDLLPEVGGSIEMILAEDLTTTYNFKEKKYQLLSEEEVKAQTDLLSEVKKKHPNIALFALDYWDPEDKETIKKIYEKDRNLGFSPYVGTIELDQIVEEPK